MAQKFDQYGQPIPPKTREQKLVEAVAYTVAGALIGVFVLGTILPIGVVVAAGIVGSVVAAYKINKNLPDNWKIGGDKPKTNSNKGSYSKSQAKPTIDHGRGNGRAMNKSRGYQEEEGIKSVGMVPLKETDETVVKENENNCDTIDFNDKSNYETIDFNDKDPREKIKSDTPNNEPYISVYVIPDDEKAEKYQKLENDNDRKHFLENSKNSVIKLQGNDANKFLDRAAGLYSALDRLKNENIPNQERIKEANKRIDELLKNPIDWLKSEKSGKSDKSYQEVNTRETRETLPFGGAE